MQQHQGKDPADDPSAEALRNEINEVTSQLHDAVEEHEEPVQLGYFLQNSMAVFNPKYGHLPLADRLGMLDEVADETTAYEQRMIDLLTAARSDEDVRQLEVLLSKIRFNIRQSEMFTFEGHDFCHSLVATR